MEKIIPYEKLSKKEQRRLNGARRGTWGALSPVTRKPQPSRAYNRKRTQAWKKDIPDLRSSFISMQFDYAKQSSAAAVTMIDDSAFTALLSIKRTPDR